MDGRHPNNDKPRPKRRKAEDNPYTLSEMVDTASMSHYYISFIDGQGRNIRLEISRELFATFDRFELDDLSFLNEVDNHYEHSELTEATLNARALHKPDTVEDIVSHRIQSKKLREAIAHLPQTQRTRLLLYYFGGKTYQQIAEMEGCTHHAVMKSVSAAIKTLKNFLDT